MDASTENMSSITGLYQLDPESKVIGQSLRCRLIGAWLIECSQSHFQGFGDIGNAAVSLMLRGENRVTIRGDKCRYLRWREGEIFCCPPFVPHSQRIVSEGTIEFISVTANFEIFNGLDLLSFFKLPFTYTGAEAEAIGNVLRRFDVVRHMAVGMKRDIQACALCYELLNELLGKAELRPDAQARLKGIERLSAALQYLGNHYTESLDLPLLASLTHLSPSRFHAIFKAATACSPSEYIRRLRLEQAGVMLMEGTARVGEVGRALGWNDPFHFSRTFKQFFGVSPKQFQTNAAANTKLGNRT
jgi:AraC-like DNA-binding protein